MHLTISFKISYTLCLLFMMIYGNIDRELTYLSSHLYIFLFSLKKNQPNTPIQGLELLHPSITRIPKLFSHFHDSGNYFMCVTKKLTFVCYALPQLLFSRSVF